MIASFCVYWSKLVYKNNKIKGNKNEQHEYQGSDAYREKA